MPKYRLRSYDHTPPGGYPYVQTKGVYRKFPSMPSIEFQAQIVSDFRKANGLERATVKEALQDIDSFTCQRLGGIATWCVSMNAQGTPVVALAANNPIIVGRCGGCGAPIT